MAPSRDLSPTSSQLSSHDSSEFGDDVKVEDADSTLDVPASDSHLMPPNKKRRVAANSSHQSTPVPQLEPQYAADAISSDTEGSIPASPSHDQSATQDDDPRQHVQVRLCKWDGCEVGDVGNMDNLVTHLHDDHIGTKETSYACEWMDCNRKGTPHASGYALKAHMRSHTKEKPFYCALPECDRAFTRSDALAKHMRTVHETEALRPSDPVPRNYNSAHFKPQRLKLTIKPPADQKDDADSNATQSPPPQDASSGLAADGGAAMGGTSSLVDHPNGIGFGREELDMPAQELYRLLRRQLYWSEEEGKRLEEEVQSLEKKRRREWMEKELVLANVMEADLAVSHMRGADEQKILWIVEDYLPGEPLPMPGAEVPWYREVDDELPTVKPD